MAVSTISFRLPGAQIATQLAMLSVLTVVALIFSGCSISDTLSERNKIDYKSAGKLPPLDIPPDLSAVKPDDQFNVPENSNRTLSGFERGRLSSPTGLISTGLLPQSDVAKLERAGSQRWLTVAMPPEKIWPILRDFWQESGFMVETENQSTGIVETNWAENRAKLPQDLLRRTLGRVADGLYSTSERDRFRTRLERGITPNSTEIYISHRGMIEVYTQGTTREQTVWQARPSDPELEIELLRKLLVKLGAPQNTASSVVNNAATAQKAVLTAPATSATSASGSTLSQIAINEPFDRAWRRVGLALDRSGFTVEDRDRSQGLYFVRYIDPEVEMKAVDGKKPGFFGNLFTSSAKPVTPAQYRIRVANASGANQTEVNVLSKEGKSITDEAERKTAGKIIAVLHDQLK